MIEIVPATLAHAEAIELRPGDAREVAALGLSQQEAFALSFSRALWADAYLDGAGEVAAIVGLSAGCLLSGVGVPWLLTGKPVDRHRKDFLKLTRAGVARMLRQFPMLTNKVHADYHEAVRWLGWLGFEISPARPYGPRAAFFHDATLLRTP